MQSARKSYKTNNLPIPFLSVTLTGCFTDFADREVSQGARMSLFAARSSAVADFEYEFQMASINKRLAW